MGDPSAPQPRSATLRRVTETQPPQPDSSAAGSPAPAEAPSGLLRLALGFYGVVTIFAFGYALFSQKLYHLFGDQAPTGAALLGGLAFGGVIVGVTRLGHKVWPAVADAGRSISLMLGPMSRREAIYVALASGFAEELLFRGALWTHLGFLGTTFLFGLVHIVPKRQLWGYPIYATACGALLGLLRHATGSVLPCILAHVLINALHLIYMADRHEAYAREEEARRARPAHLQ